MLKLNKSMSFAFNTGPTINKLAVKGIITTGMQNNIFSYQNLTRTFLIMNFN